MDQIRIVEPGDITELAITPGQDYCTLVTCTPYGINTHRLLIRGHRVPNERGEMVVPAEAYRISNHITIPAIGVPLLFLFLIVMLIVFSGRKPNLRDEEFYRMIGGLYLLKEKIQEIRTAQKTKGRDAGHNRAS